MFFEKLDKKNSPKKDKNKKAENQSDHDASSEDRDVVASLRESKISPAVNKQKVQKANTHKVGLSKSMSVS